MAASLPKADAISAPGYKSQSGLSAAPRAPAASLQPTLLLGLEVAGIMLLAGWFCFYNLGTGSFSSDETITVSVTQNMLAGKHFWRLHAGHHVYYGKPPLKMWLTLFPVWLIGQSNFSYRLLDALFGVVTCLMVYFMGRSMFRSRLAGWTAVLALLGCRTYLMDHVVRRAVQDSFLVMLFTAGMWLGWLALVKVSPGHALWQPAERLEKFSIWKLTAVLGAVLGCAALSKSVAVLVMLAVLSTYVLLAPERWKLIKALFAPLLAAILISLLISAPYFISRCLEGPGVCSGVLALGAVRKGITLRAADPNYWKFFHQLFIAQRAVHPWLFVSAVLFACFMLRKNGDRRLLYLLNWSAVPYIVCTLMRGKGLWYNAPAFPGMSLLVGAAFCQARNILNSPYRSPVCMKLQQGALVLLWCWLAYGLGTGLLLTGREILTPRPTLPVNRLADWIRADKKIKTIIHSATFAPFREGAYMRMIKTSAVMAPDLETMQRELNSAAGPVVAVTPLLFLDEVFRVRPPAGYLDLPPADVNWKSQDKAALLYEAPPAPPFSPIRTRIPLDSDKAPVLYGWSGLHPMGGDFIRWSHGPSSAVTFEASAVHLQLGIKAIFSLARSPEEKKPFTVQPYVNHTALAPFTLSSRYISEYPIEVPRSVLRLGRNVIELEYQPGRPLVHTDRAVLSDGFDIVLGEAQTPPILPTAGAQP